MIDMKDTKIILWDVVMDEFREQYDRESYLWVVVKVDEQGTNVAAIEKDWEWYYFNWLEQYRLHWFYKEKRWVVSDYGLSV